jgi:Flp pilus assembly protein TadD
LARLLKLDAIKPEKRALKKAGKRTLRMEAAGQLNMFDQIRKQGKVVQSFGDIFQKAIYLDEHDDPAAMEAYLEAVEKGIYPEDALCNIATLQAANGDLLSAISTLSEALVRNPRHQLAHYNLGNVYLEAGNLQLAELHYEQALRSDPTLIEVYFNLALVLLLKGDRARATSLLEEYQSRSSETIDIKQLISRLMG